MLLSGQLSPHPGGKTVPWCDCWEEEPSAEDYKNHYFYLMRLYERPLLHIHKLADGNAEIMRCGELGEGLFFSYTLFYMNLHQVPQAERISQTKLQVLKLTTFSPDSTEECRQGY